MILLPDSGHLVIEGPRLDQVTIFIFISLVFKIFSVVLYHGLPRTAHLLHHFERAHINVCRHNLRPRLLHENHVGREALFRLFNRRALTLQRLQLLFVPFFVSFSLQFVDHTVLLSHEAPAAGDFPNDLCDLGLGSLLEDLRTFLFLEDDIG